MASNPQMVIRIAANIEELKKNLLEGRAAVEALGPSVEKYADRWKANSERVVRTANDITAAVTKIGAATMTSADASKALKQIESAMAQLQRAGQTVPAAMANVAAELRQVASASSKAKDDTSSLSASLTSSVAIGSLVASGFQAVGSAILGMVKTGLTAIPDLIGKATQLGGSLFDMSLKTGASVENLSRLRYVSSQTGISMEAFTNSMFKMQTALGKAGDEAGQTGAALRALGLESAALKNSRPDEAFVEVMKALEQVPNRADQARIGMALFGKGFKEMAGLTQESISELMSAADDLGLVYSTEFAAAADVAGDAIERLKMQWEALTVRVGAAFLPAVIGLAEGLSNALAGAIRQANTALEAMGGNNGFLATVARAMGTGNEALAAQVKLYETLRDAVVSVVRGAIIPAISAIGELMVLFNAAKVVFGDLVQVVALVGFGFKEAALRVAEFGHYVSFGKLWKEDLVRIKGELADMAAAIEARGKALQRYKANEDWWAAGAKAAVAEVEATMERFAQSHVDIAKVITDNAKLAREAGGSMSAGLAATADTAEEAAKKLASLTKEASTIATTWQTMTAQGATAEQIFAAVGTGAAGLRAKFAALGRDIPADVQNVVDAIRDLGLSVNISKWMEQQRVDIRKLLEAQAKDTEAVVAKQREAVNKAFLGNAQEQVKALTDLEKLEQDSLDKRLRAVARDAAARRAALDEHASNYEASLATITRYEQAAAEAATQAWNDHLATLKRQMGPSFLDIFRDALNGIPRIISAAFTGGGGIAGAINAALSDVGSAIGAKLGGMVARAIDGPLGKLGAKVGGAIFDMLPGIGGAVGAAITPLLGKAWSAISKSEGRKVNDLRDAYIAAAGGFDKLVEQARKAGVELSSSSAFQAAKTTAQWEKAVADLNAKLQKATEDRKRMLDEVMAGERLATQALLDEMATAARGSADAAGEAAAYYSATLKQASSGLTQMFGGLEKASAQADARMLAAKKDALATATGEQKDALERDIALLERAVEDGQHVFIRSQEQAAGLAGAIAGTFGKMREHGASMREALSAVAGPLDSLRTQLEITGFTGGAAFEALSRLGEAASGEVSGPLLDAIDGANTALIGLHNSGLLTQESFVALGTTASQAYEQLIAQGTDGATALQLMQPTLQTIWEMQRKFGYECDEATQALLEEAIAAGQVGEAHMSAQDRAAEAMERVADVMERIAVKMGVDLPKAAEVGASRIADAFGSIDPRIKEPWADWSNPPTFTFESGSQVAWGGAQATGGDYLVNRPTLFLAGEAGTERVTFSRPGRSAPISITVVSQLDGKEVARNQVRYLPTQLTLAGV